MYELGIVDPEGCGMIPQTQAEQGITLRLVFELVGQTSYLFYQCCICRRLCYTKNNYENNYNYNNHYSRANL